MFVRCKFHPTSGIARDLADRQNLFLNVGTLNRKKLYHKLYCPREKDSSKSCPLISLYPSKT